MRAILVILAVFSTLPGLASVNCFGDIVFDNGAGGASGIDNGFVSDLDFPAIQADDFSFAVSEFVVSIGWTGAYAADNTAPAVDDFTIFFYLDNAGQPGSLVNSYNVGSNITRTDSGVDLFGFDIYEYSATFSGQSFNGSQTYWMSIANNTLGENDDWYWGVQINNGNSYGSGNGGTTWLSQNNRHDFWMNAIPESGSGCLSVIGLILFAARRRVRRR